MRDGFGTSVASTPNNTPTTWSTSWSSSSIACRPKPRRALRQLACVGSSAEFALLGTVCQTSEEELHESLWEAVRSGLVHRSENSYAFQHDRIQEAAYSLIPEDARAEAHLRIGRLLVAHTPPDKREEVIFDIVNQFNRGAELITSEDERYQVAELNLVAGKRAKASTAYASALRVFHRWRSALDEGMLGAPPRAYLPAGIAPRRVRVLDRRSGQSRQSAWRCFARAPQIPSNWRWPRAWASMFTSRSYQIDRAVGICLEYLRHLGIDWPLHPTEEEVRSEYMRIWSQLGSSRDRGGYRPPPDE